MKFFEFGIAFADLVDFNPVPEDDELIKSDIFILEEDFCDLPFHYLQMTVVIVCVVGADLELLSHPQE